MKRPLKRIALIIIGLVLLGLLVWAFVPKPIEVDVAPVGRGPLQVAVEEEGQTRIQERYVITAPLEGQLQRVTLEPGDAVHAGKTVLAVIEPKDPTLLDPRSRAEAEARVEAAEVRVRQADTQVDFATAQLEIAQSEHARLLRALPEGGASAKEVEDARLLALSRAEALRIAQFSADIARYELRIARAALVQTFSPTTAAATGSAGSPATSTSIELVSPIDGKVLRLIRESSMPVVAGSEILEVGDPRDLEVEMEVLSTEAVKVSPGDKVQFVRWGGDQPLNGVVRLVEPQAFEKISALGVEEQRVLIISDLTDPPQQYQSLGDAFRVDGRIVVWEDPDALIVPTSALFRRGEQWQAFAVQDGRAILTDVRIGRMNGLLAQVLAGLDAGDIVIVHPSDLVEDGARVEPRSP